MTSEVLPFLHFFNTPQQFLLRGILIKEDHTILVLYHIRSLPQAIINGNNNRIVTIKAKKYYLLAVSHSPMEIVQNFARGLGFDKVYGRIYEVGRGRKFTGARPYDHLIDDKGKILSRACEKAGLTLRESVGVGDTESDVAFLKMVERPICFNPNKRLYEYAKRRGWRVVVERKDVVYER